MEQESTTKDSNLPDKIDSNSSIEHSDKHVDNLDSNVSYLSEIDKIMKSELGNEDKANLIDLIVRDFLRKNYHFKKSNEYSDMIEFFLEKGKPNIATLCHEMIEVLYSGEKIDDVRLGIIIDDFRTAISSGQGTSNSQIKIEEPTLKSLVDPITNLFKKKEKTSNSKSNSRYVSKQIKHSIEGYISGNTNGLNSSKNEVENKYDLDKEFNSLSKKYPVERMISEVPNPEDAQEYQLIEGIDNLERIKMKVRQRRAVGRSQQLNTNQ